MLLLRHERNLLPKRLERELDEPDAADLDLPGARRVDAREKPAECRLARARRADDGNALARAQVEVDAVEHVPADEVRVPHVPRRELDAVGLTIGRSPVGRNGGDADEPRERRGADLDLVEPGDEPVDRVGQLLRVEDDGRDLADRGMTRVNEPPTPEQPGDDRAARRRSRRSGTSTSAAEACTAPPGRRPEVGVRPADAVLVEAERLDREPAVDRLAHAPREPRVGGALPEVPLRRAAQVPPRSDPERRDAGDERERRGRAHPDRCGHGEHGRERGDEGLGDREPNRSSQRVDVGRRAGHEVARPRALDGRERKREDAAHEVLAQLGEHQLRDDERRPSRAQVSTVCSTMKHREDEHDRVDVRARRPLRDRLDERAEQAGAASPAPAASAWSPTTPPSAARCRRASIRAWRRSSGPSAIGSSAVTRSPPA